MTHLAARMAEIEAFHVMDILARGALEAQGRDVVHMEIGEPDFPTPDAVVEAGIAALRAGHTHYTPSLGLPALREAIAGGYPAGCQPDPSSVIVTPGSSGALVLAFGVLINPGDEVLMADPGYPCNRHFVRMFEGRARLVPVGPDTGYQLTAELLRRYWSPRTRAVLISSPSNPTGTLVPDAELAAIVAAVRELGGVLIVDEIYHGLTYGVEAGTALRHSPDVFVVNSFSKFYGMTGSRVGWLVAPPAYVDAIDRLAQNIFLATSTPAQHAALAVFQPEVQDELERRRAEFEARRDILLPALRGLGFRIPVVPQGAFYLYADCSDLTGYKKQAARHIVAASPAAFDGKLPEILKSVGVLDLTIDRDGKVVKATVRRSNGYKDLEATALDSVRRAGRLPAPSAAVHRGAPTISYLETWLFRADGRFQIRSLAEPQPVAAASN